MQLFGHVTWHGTEYTHITHTHTPHTTGLLSQCQNSVSYASQSMGNQQHVADNVCQCECVCCRSFTADKNVPVTPTGMPGGRGSVQDRGPVVGTGPLTLRSLGQGAGRDE